MKSIIIYNSKTGFTKEYAKILSKELNIKTLELKDINKENLKEYDTLIFGSRIIAGKIQKLKEIKKIKNKNNIKNLIIYTTGATPNEAKDVLEKMWQNNLIKEELNTIPHFHMQSGMNLEKLPLIEKIMISLAKKMIKKQQEKNQNDQEFENAISNSFNIFDKKYTNDLIKYLKGSNNNE